MYLVTGGAGFIGSHLVEYLLNNKYNVRVIDNFSSGKIDNLKSVEDNASLEIINGDISNYSEVNDAMEGIEGIFHQAALVSVEKSIHEPSKSFVNNAQGTFNIFEAARKNNIKRIVFASSAAIYGDNNNLPVKECSEYQPLSPYALDKVYAEKLANLYYSLYGLESVALRYFNVYGPRQDHSSPYSGVISIFISNLLCGETPTIYGDGKQTRDFVYVKDVVEANIKAMDMRNSDAHCFNIGTEHGSTILELIDMISSLIERQSNLDFSENRKGDIRHSVASIDKAMDMLNWKPKYDLYQGLKNILDVQ